MMKTVLLAFLLCITGLCFAQDGAWKFENEKTVRKLNTQRLVVPGHYQTVSLNPDKYKEILKASPSEITTNILNGLEISIPYPDKSFKRFKIVETKIMEEALAAKFPDIKTYVGKSVDDPSTTIRIDYTYQGFHACVLSPGSFLFIDPYQKGNKNLYITYFSKDYINAAKGNLNCTSNALNRSADINEVLTGTCIGTELKTYRAAVSCTGEYAIAVCPAGNVTIANTLSAIVTTINRVTGIYEKEVDIRLMLIANENLIIYTNPLTDPYIGNNDGNTLIDESQSNITSVIGSANFDIGHTFSTGGGGIASYGVVCDDSQKARGVTGITNPVGDFYDVDYVAHEMGHQFGASHPFESQTNFCGNGNRQQFSAYEVGGGTTIMSYSGLCSSDNIQPHSDPYFHTKNFDEIVAYTISGTGSTCGVSTATGNNPPVVVMPPNNLKIPKQTPFTLTGSATDPNGDPLTYSWEEWDLSNSAAGSAWNSGATSSVKPLFRSRLPKTTGSRTFPDIAVILAKYPPNPPSAMDGLKGETLPQVARDIKFRLTVRDNKALGGGVVTGGDGCSATAIFKVIVTDDGPFTVTSPNTAVNWMGGSTQNVTWNVANTNSAAGINCQNVNILMSTDGGLTYPTVVLSGTPNDGTQSIVVPNIPTNNTVRFMVRANGNIFFDISDNNFTITNAPLPVVILNFSATAGDNSIFLSWSTETEINNKGFEIERSEGSADNFTRIGFINGAINSNTPKNYSFEDDSIKQNIEYFYRLRQIDLDERSFYSSIETAKVVGSEKFAISVQPQPFYKNLSLVLNGLQKKNFTLMISDMQGRILLKKEVNNTETNTRLLLPLNDKASGIYIVKVIQDGTIKVTRAVKLGG